MDIGLRVARVWGACVPFYYHKERNHQGLDSKIIRPQFQNQDNTRKIKCNERLGGLLKYYSRQGA
jgi:hypothetical protein